jgi:hypothetical protein
MENGLVRRIKQFGLIHRLKSVLRRAMTNEKYQMTNEK